MLKLKVININSPIDLTHHDCAYTEQVIFKAEDLDKTNKRWNSENSISHLIENTPIFLLKEESMPEYKYVEILNQGFEKPPTELLGFYTRANIWGDKSENTPSIFICPEVILKHSVGVSNNKFLDISYQELLAKVIIHEFAHVIMDVEPEHSSLYEPFEFYPWLEEPFANWFVLKYFESYGHGASFTRVSKFIERQPKNYKLGLNLFKSKLTDGLWKKWQAKKCEIIEYASKEKWLKFANDVSGINDNISTELSELLNS